MTDTQAQAKLKQVSSEADHFQTAFNDLVDQFAEAGDTSQESQNRFLARPDVREITESLQRRRQEMEKIQRQLNGMPVDVATERSRSCEVCGKVFPDGNVTCRYCLTAQLVAASRARLEGGVL